jgi:hypothetical protein
VTTLNRRWIETALLLFAGCAAVYFLTAPGRIDMIDGGIRFDVTRSIIDVGLPIVRHPWMPAVEGRGGLRYSFYPLGTSIVAVPFVQLGDWLGGGSLESRQFAFSLTSIPFAAGTVSLLFLIWGRLGCSRRAALGWALVVAFCTPLWVYAGSSFDTVIQAFFLTLAVWAAIEAIDARSWSWAAVSGFAFAALINVQETYAVLGACVFADESMSIESVRARLRSRPIRIILGGLVLGVATVLAFNAYKFGHPLETGRDAVPHPLLGWMPIGLIGLFASPAKSILLYSPTYLFAAFGLRKLYRSNRSRYVIVAACLAIHILLTSTLKFWAGEWAWGPRYLLVSLPLVCLGLPFVSGTRATKWLYGAAVAGLAVQLLGISVDHQRYYVERSLTPFFWVDEWSMYRDSPLVARPAELWSIARREDLSTVRALVPARDEMSMTSSLFGPPFGRRNDQARWMREFLVFVVPRPWPFWTAYLPQELRPGRTDLMLQLGLAAALAAFGLLGLRLRDEEEVVRASVSVAARTSG